MGKASCIGQRTKLSPVQKLSMIFSPKIGCAVNRVHPVFLFWRNPTVMDVFDQLFMDVFDQSLLHPGKPLLMGPLSKEDFLSFESCKIQVKFRKAP